MLITFKTFYNHFYFQVLINVSTSLRLDLENVHWFEMKRKIPFRKRRKHYFESSLRANKRYAEISKINMF